jgi:hypothetical protein
MSTSIRSLQSCFAKQMLWSRVARLHWGPGTGTLGLTLLLGLILHTLATTAWAQVPGFGLNVRSFGAAGDCRHDDTAAFQSAVDQIDGRILYVPSGCYLLTRPISIPLAYGWSIVGESRTGTIIKQQTDNTPIFVLKKEGSHSWRIQGLQFQWTRNQPSTNRNSIAILFAADTATGGGIFEFTIADVAFINGFRGISLAPAVPGGGSPVWGFLIDHVSASSTMSGSTININPVPSIGQPRCNLRDVYSNQPSSEPQIVLRRCNSSVLEAIEDNNGLDTSIDLTGSMGVTVIGVHVELHKMTRPGSSVIVADNSEITMTGITGGVASVVPGNYYMISNTSGGGRLSVRDVTWFGSSARFQKLGETPGTAHKFLFRLGGGVKVDAVEGMNLIDLSAYDSSDTQTRQVITNMARPPLQ